MSEPFVVTGGLPATVTVGPLPAPGPENVAPTEEQVERFLAAAHEELGPECTDDWVRWIDETLRAAVRSARRS